MASVVNAGPIKVVVTGAGGQTGQLLFRKMLALPDEFQPLGIVRTQESKDALTMSDGETPPVPASSVAIADIADPDSIRQVIQEHFKSSTDKDDDDKKSGVKYALCIGTSAKVKAIPGKTDPETGRPILGFPDGQPEQIDWIGQKNQIDACPPGTHIVICSSMGGTDPSNRLNAFGKTTLPDGTEQGGNILKWKRKAEMYLIEKCTSCTSEAEKEDYTYTIVHPGGLINEPGGEREIVAGVDDSQEGTESRSIPRADVAQVMLEAVRHGTKSYKNRSFDIRAKPVGEGTVTTNFETLLDVLNGRNCDYSLGEIM